jgi:hypothetical protein
MSSRYLPVPAATFVVAALVPLVLGVTAGAARAQSLQRIAGDVVAHSDHRLTVRTTLGQAVDLRAPDNLRVTVRVPAKWSDIDTGSYVGTTATPQADGTLLAKEVHVFPESQRGRGEGYRPMPTPGDTMTNATVSSVHAPRRRDTMTNAMVAGEASGPSGHRLTLTYKGGEKTVIVPEGVPLVASEPGDRSLLVPGAHVVVYAHAEGDTLTAERVSVGKDGFRTPI